MPRRIAVKDRSLIYYAYKIGTRSDGVPFYCEPKSCFAQISDVSGTSQPQYWGAQDDYDLRLIIDLDQDVKYIDEETKIWVFATPISWQTESDYIILREPQVKNGQLYISCDKVAENSESIYFAYGEQILSIKVEFDYENKVFYVKPNKYLNIDIGDTLWYSKPEGTDSQDFSMTVTEIKDEGRRIAYLVDYGDEEGSYWN